MLLLVLLLVSVFGFAPRVGDVGIGVIDIGVAVCVGVTVGASVGAGFCFGVGAGGECWY